MGCRIISGALIALAAFPLFALEIATNAAGGMYSSDQRLWFSVPGGERLVLNLDGTELYRGAGPTSILLGAEAGTERQYELKAERRSAPPEDRLLESRTYLVLIDRKPPEGPAVTSRKGAGGAWTVVASSADRVDAAILQGGEPRILRNVVSPIPVPSGGLDMLAWAVDGAGNSSEPVAYSFEPLALRVDSPAEGTWLNPQRLIADTRGGGELLWTEDGTDPLGGGGKLYTGPAPIERTGDVLLRLAHRGKDGDVETREIRYTVRNSFSYPPELAAAELHPITEETRLAIPQGMSWGIGGSPINPGGREIVLRPVSGLRRTVSLQVASPEGAARFAYILDGIEPEKEDSGRTSAGTDTGVEAETMPAMHASGALRVLRWPKDRGNIRYRLGTSGPWMDAAEPVLLPRTEPSVEWIAERGPVVAGPFTLPASVLAGAKASPIRSSVQLRAAFGNGEWIDARSGTALFPGDLSAIDVCDGEDLEWRPAAEGSLAERVVRVDRLAPGAPEVDAPKDGAWTTAPLGVSASAADADGATKVLLRLRKTYPSGKVSESTGVGGLVLEEEPEVPVEIRLEAVAEDPAGNRGPVSVRTFTVDAPAVYVSGPASGDGAPERADGSRGAPFPNLDRAVETARLTGIRIIRISGSLAVRGRIALPAGLRMEGFYDQDWRPGSLMADLRLAEGAGFLVSEGSVEVASLRLIGGAGTAPLILCGAGSSLLFSDGELIGRGTLLSAADARLRLVNALAAMRSTGTPRIPAFSLRGGETKLERVRVEAAGKHAMGLEQRGGVLSVENTVVSVEGSLTGLGVFARDVQQRFADAVVKVSAADFGSCLESAGGSLSFQGGSLEASGRDAVAVALNGTGAEFSEMELRVSSAFVAKAIETKNAFPSVRDSSLAYSGKATKAELFSSSAGSVSGNRIQGFSHLIGNAYGVDRLLSFNRDFAGGGRHNILVEGSDLR